jgi:hypothetical protein
MAAGTSKLRFAIGIFEDLAGLGRAADALVDLGLDPADLCFVARPGPALDDATGRWVLAERTSQTLWFQHADPGLSASSGDCLAIRAASLITPMLGATVAPPAYRSPVYDVWSTMNTHLAEGEFLLVARLSSPSLQDQATRALLRYSRRPVHAEEFFTPLETG